MSAFHLVTLGPLRLVDAAGADYLRGRRKELALLAFIARRAPRDVPRDELTALLWGERGDDRARHSLRQTLLRLKQALGSVVDAGASHVRLAPDAITVDATTFEADISAGRHREAVGRWHGDFLRDADDAGGEVFRTWVEQERESLRRRFAFALATLLDDAEARRAWEEAAAIADRLVELRPLDEAAYARLIAALRASGRMADALARYAAAGAAIRDHGHAPSPILADLGAELERFTSAPRLSPGSTALLTPDLVGRDAALGELESAWRHAPAGGSVVLIEGDAGIGKTRLAAEFVRWHRTGSAATLVLECRAADTDRAAPWATARRLLAGLARTPRLDAVSNRSLGTVAALVPALRERFPHLASPATRDDVIVDAILDVLRLVTQRTHVMLVVDDVPRSDAATRELLLALVGRPLPNVLTVLAGRSEELAQSPISDELGRAPAARRIKLQPLAVTDVERLVASMLELSPAERAALAARLYADSGGNPFYVTELVSVLADTGLLALGSGGTWTLASDFADRALPLPGGVRGAIRQRLDLLDGDARSVIETCALAGPLAPRVLLTVTQLDDARFTTAIETLVARRLLRSSTDAGATRYELSHELLRRVTEELVPPTRRDAIFAAVAIMRDDHSADGSSAAEGIEQTRQRNAVVRRSPLRMSRRAVAAVAGAVVLGSAGAVWRSARSSPVDVPHDRVLVAPFANETADSTLDPLAGITADWIAQGIARTGLVKVVPLAVSGDDARDSGASTPQRGRAGRRATTTLTRARARAIGVDAGIVVWGSYVRSGDSLRFQATITDAASGELLQSTPPVVSHLSTPLVAIEVLRRRTLAALAPFVDTRMAGWARVASTPPSYEAYLAFAEGLDAFMRSQPDRDMLAPFLRAYALDTSFTLPLLYAAWGLSGGGHHVRADSILGLLVPRRATLASFDRALLDYLVAAHRRDRTASYAAALAVAEIAPQSDIAAVGLPYAALAINRPYRAREILERVHPERGQVRDNSGYWDAYAHALHLTGDYERQLAVARALRARDPSESVALSYEARALAALGRVAEVSRVLEQSIGLPADTLWGAPGLRHFIVASDELRAHGHPSAADSVLERAIRVYSHAPEEVRNIPKQRFEMARAYYRLGKLAEATAILEPLVAANALAPLGDYMIEARAHLGFLAARMGDTATANATDRWLRDLRGPHLLGQNTELRAALHALLGHRDDAVRLLHQAMAEGRFFDVGKHVYFEYQRLRGYPPFEEWLAPKG